ncbi:hypothetical protein A2276_02435 [candidate division WOR-1 bacterium RIFOXYA12_FULL_43_27]|uniref:Four helix bundle protein n=1 Tax=candidate division WOR-1 bacterium RIFOXYC2_FULL_46_14 TaxID=1802587 RepID=A0A1F4U845_UNCSA|nr:MAG: hypothetical protein A2276_02435 [candidate division WOR-1 bacterium RIFOXYA12_FULL_43_27]OGC19431.1 MAG: hypothetical protein A2292_01895 [candidate division WOR-1 bacterium RIFOXYB2_FULL_46_45]OGC30420.1 MAG: hypothetical protein A2232_01895 [candidate division WOR-1 bacterium RIFOXYA2_FULL_46_56]OGC41020.1 MAG: hypothetical protein A2438_01895 [candidate division WOR-1 bacterium RIFOXYC2_FULL_46_14]
MTNDQIPNPNESTKSKSKKYDIKERGLDFAVRVGIFTNKTIKNQATLEYGKQLIRSSGSIGANLEEADGTLTKKDFINKMAIARREARESKYWLRLIQQVNRLECPELVTLIGEANELVLILSAIINKVKIQ